MRDELLELISRPLGIPYSMIAPPQHRPPPAACGLLRLAWLALVVSHLSLCVALCLAFVALPFVTNWYIWAPLCTFIGRIATDSTPCVLTTIENHLRQRMGWPQIDGFIVHYGGKYYRAVW